MRTLGWRVWVLEESALQALHGGFTWPAGRPATADCERPHRAPGRGCGCGLWARYDLASLIDAWYFHEGGVFGAVIAWGEVAFHGDEGFRAEHARPVFLVRDAWRLAALTELGVRAAVATPEEVDRVADTYGVPSVPVAALPYVASEFGLSIDRDWVERMAGAKAVLLPCEEGWCVRRIGINARERVAVCERNFVWLRSLGQLQPCQELVRLLEQRTSGRVLLPTCHRPGHPCCQTRALPERDRLVRAIERERRSSRLRLLRARLLAKRVHLDLLPEVEVAIGRRQEIERAWGEWHRTGRWPEDPVTSTAEARIS